MSSGVTLIDFSSGGYPGDFVFINYYIVYYPIPESFIREWYDLASLFIIEVNTFSRRNPYIYIIIGYAYDRIVT